MPIPLAAVQPVEWTGLADQFHLWSEKESPHALGFSNLGIRRERLLEQLDHEGEFTEGKAQIMHINLCQIFDP